MIEHTDTDDDPRNAEIEDLAASLQEELDALADEVLGVFTSRTGGLVAARLYLRGWRRTSEGSPR